MFSWSVIRLLTFYINIDQYLPKRIHTPMYTHMHALDIFRYKKKNSFFEKCVITCDAGELAFDPPDPSPISLLCVPGRWTLRDC